MNPQRRTALISVAAAAALIALKLVPGLATNSLGLISEALHSGTDLVAALLTFFAIGVAARPADRAHAYGHGKAEHLAALAEAGFLVAASVFIIWRAVSHILGRTEPTVQATWYALAVIGAVIVIDASRTLVSVRTSQRYRSAALQSNALHFASDLVGSVAVLIGLVFVRAGFDDADSAAALFVAVLVVVAAARLIRRNVDVLMDRAPADAYEAAQSAISGIEPPVQLRRLRIRQAAGRHFADVVIGVAADAAVGQGHAAADAVEDAIERALPETDVVVHVEPLDAAGREPSPTDMERDAEVVVRIVRDATGRPPRALRFLRTDDGLVAFLTLALDPDSELAEAHSRASEIEEQIREAVDVSDVIVHTEP